MTDAKPSTMKPCPFCGGAGKTVHQRWSGRDFHGVTCDGECGTFFDCRQPTEGQAVDAWNRRPEDRALNVLQWLDERGRNSQSYGSHADAYEIAARRLREALGLPVPDPQT